MKQLAAKKHERTRNRLPDVILADVEMPRIDGQELFALVKRLENLRGTTAVIVNSRSSNEHC